MVMSFKIYEVVKNYTYAPFSYAFFAVAMNQKKWTACLRKFRTRL